MFNKLKNFIKRKIQACIPQIEQNTSLDQVILLNQYHLMKHTLPTSSLPKLSQVGFRVRSQFEEDGLLLYIFALIGTETKRVVEICAGDGKECMAANLLINHGWEGLLFDGDPESVKRGIQFYATHPNTWLHPPKFIQSWITKDNINDLIINHGFSGGG
jgi:hypothetical protein